MVLCNTEVTFDLMDEETAERYEKAAKEVDAAQKNIPSEKSLLKVMKYQRKVITAFFAELFGEETAERIFEGSKNLRDYITAFKVLIEEAQRQSGEIVHLIKGFDA